MFIDEQREFPGSLKSSRSVFSGILFGGGGGSGWIGEFVEFGTWSGVHWAGEKGMP